MGNGIASDRLGQEARALERARDLHSIRTAPDVDALRRALADHLQFSIGKDEHSATDLDRYLVYADVYRHPDPYRHLKRGSEAHPVR